MYTIPLRVYNREIEEALEQKQFDEAIAHCRHILKVFPKHINTYRLLGKAYLESQRYGNAADIFQRVLSSIPDDFISHVGMSIIREDEGNLDAAIWHMERSFEIQPYNTAIQGELRRLYGQRDGMEPPKIRMTRGALARMYAKNDLYDQAISEINSNLVEDPQRADLEVLLAQMYEKNGQQTEAIQVYSSLLKRLPYCLEASRYLSQVFSEGDRGDERKSYRHKLESLNPYEAHVSPRIPTASDVPDHAVTLNRLDWDGGMMIADDLDQPEWATSIGVKIDEDEALDEGTPDWFRDSTEEPAESFEPLSGTRKSIPNWMQEAGWSPSKGEFDESASSFDFDEESIGREHAVVGDIPDWLQDIAPEEIVTEDQAITFDNETAGADLPSWLVDEANGASDTIVNWLDDKSKEVTPEGTDEAISAPTDRDDSLPAEPSTEFPPISDISRDTEIPDWIEDLTTELPSPSPDELPDWLSDLDTSETPESSHVEELSKADVDEEIYEPVIGDIADQRQEIEAEVIGTDIQEAMTAENLEDEEQVEIFDHLHDIEEEIEPEIMETISLSDLTDEEPVEIPDWLKDLETELPKPEPLEQPTSADMQPLDIFVSDETLDEAIQESEPDGLPDWLSGLPKQEITEEVQTEEEPAESMDEIEPISLPDWLQDISKDETDSTIPSGVTGWLKDMDEEELNKMVIDYEPGELPDWLENLVKERNETQDITNLGTIEQDEDETQIEFLDLERIPDIDQDISPERPEMVSGAEIELPDWLLDQDEIVESERAQDLKTETDTTASTGDETLLVSQESVLDFEDADAAMAWLEGLAAKKGISEDELLTRPEDRPESPPEWVQAEIDAAAEVVVPDIKLPESLTEIPSEEPEQPIDLEEVDTLEIEVETAVEIPEKSEDLDEGEVPDIEHLETPPEMLIEAAGSPTEESRPDHDFENAEAAMAWLESLATEQDVSEEELLTIPVEGSIETTEWTQKEMAGETVDEVPTWLEETLSGETLLDETAPKVQSDGESQEEIPDWLKAIYQSESLLQDEEITQIPEETSLEVIGTEHQEIAPERMLSGTTDELPELEDLESTEELVSEVIDSISEETHLEPAYDEGEVVPADQSEIEPPAWVLSGEEPESETYQWLPTEIEDETIKAETVLDLNEASMIQLERLSPLGFRKAQAIIAYRNENGPFEDISDLLFIPGIDQEIINQLESNLIVKPLKTAETPIETEGEPSLMAEDDLHALQLGAQADMRNGKIEPAIEKYEQLIRQGKRLNEVMSDLSQAIAEGLTTEKLVDTLTNLGDAFLKDDQLQAALDAYSQAEKILG